MLGALLSFSSFAVEPIEPFGRLRIGYAYDAFDIETLNQLSCEQNTPVDDCSDTSSYLTSQGSYIGFKGARELGGTLEALYRIGFYLNIANHRQHSDYLQPSEPVQAQNALAPRNQYIGLRGSYGTLIFGRDETVLHKAQGTIDLFDEQPGSIDLFFAGEQRPSQVFSYVSPRYYDLQLGFSVTPKDAPEQQFNQKTYEYYEKSRLAYAASITYGDTYLEVLPFYIAAAFSSGYHEYDHTTSIAPLDINAPDINEQYLVSGQLPMQVIRLILQYKYNDLKLGAMGQWQDLALNDDTVPNYYAKGTDVALQRGDYERDTQQLLVLNLTYRFLDLDIKLQSMIAKDLGGSATFGFDYLLSDLTYIYLFYSKVQRDSYEMKTDMQGTIQGIETSHDVIGLGMLHHFY